MEVNGVKNELLSKGVYESLPPLLKQLTEEFSGREKDLVLLSSIGVLSSCMPNIFGVYDGGDIYPNLYVLIVAPPASGKGVIKYAKKLIRPIHDKILKESRDEQKSCQEENKRKMRNKGSDMINCPPLEIKILPANISTAQMYSYMGASKHGLLIFESEADTMGNMLSNDWSNYSDVLRKAFHHEPISISRKMENIYEDIIEPKLSMVISGTPSQLKPLMSSKENGLFSRFLYYTFDEVNEFKNVFQKSSIKKKAPFDTRAEEVFELYGSLIELGKRLEFKYTDSQQREMIEKFKQIQSIVLNDHTESFLPNVKRHGLIMFKLSMIFTVLRQESFNKDKLVCHDADFKSALEITEKMLKHALIVFYEFDYRTLHKNDEEFLFALTETFSRKDAIKLGSKIGIPKRTVDDKLAQWRRKKAISRIAQGRFKRLIK